MKIILLLSLLICLIISTNSVKLFIQNTNFLNQKNWKENQLPCQGNHLIFPKKIPRVLLSSSESFHVTDIDLPINGELILDDSVKITGAHIESGVHECDSTVSHFIKVLPDFWYNPFNWCETETNASQCLNKPQVEASMVPSANDFVVFPAHNSFYVGFNPSEPQILAKTIFFRNQIYTNSQLFRNKIKRTFSRKNVEFVNVNSTYPPDFDLQGNRCKRNLCLVNSNLETGRMKAICQYVICQPLSCLQQVKPKGSCCSLCGHILMVRLINISKKSLFRRWFINLFRILFPKKIKYDLLSTESDQFQITVSPKNEKSPLEHIIPEILKKINEMRSENGAQSVNCTSCTPTNSSSVKTKSDNVAVILIIVIIIVSLVSILILIKKRPDIILKMQSRLPKIPKLQTPKINFNFFSNNFPRFRLKEPYDDSIGVSADGVENIELPNTEVEVSFDNPMYVPDINDTNN